MDLMQSIKARYPTMSGAQKRIADYILSSTDSFLYQSSSQVGAALGISESTVVRFASMMGFPKFKELQQALKRQMVRRLDLVEQFHQHTIGKDDLLYPLRQDLTNIEDTFHNLSSELIDQAVGHILAARLIGVVAIRGAVAPALVLSQFLNELLQNTRLLTPGTGDSFDVIRGWDQRDLLICCEFIPARGYVYRMLEYGKQRGCRTVSILGELANCLYPLSDVILEVKKDGSFISYTAALVLVNILLHAVGQRNDAGAVRSLADTQEILRLANGCPPVSHGNLESNLY